MGNSLEVDGFKPRFVMICGNFIKQFIQLRKPTAGCRVPGFESSSLVARIRDAPVHYLEIETPEALLLNKWHEIRYNVGFSPKSMGID